MIMLVPFFLKQEADFVERLRSAASARCGTKCPIDTKSGSMA